MGRLTHTARVAALLAALPASTSAIATAQRPQPAPDAVVEADRLHREADAAGYPAPALREQVRVLEEALRADPRSYALLWRAARAANRLGTHLAGTQRKDAFERAIALGRRAVAASPDGVEGHYWLGASYGRAAQARGGLGGFLLARKLRGEMEAVLRLQPGYEGGDAYLALGELDRGLPGFLGGDAARGRRTLEQGLRVSPGNPELKLALAEAYLDEHRRKDARALLAQVVSARPAPARDVVRRARELLASTAPREQPALPANP